MHLFTIILALSSSGATALAPNTADFIPVSTYHAAATSQEPNPKTTAVEPTTGPSLEEIETEAVERCKAEGSEDSAFCQTINNRREGDFGDRFGLGAGLSLTWDLGSRSRIGDASVVNGIVRVDDQNNANARIMLETHYFFTPKINLFGTGYRNLPGSVPKWGWGPFIAVQPGSDNIIDAIGLGMMVGFKRNDNPEDTSSWNIGVGIVIDPNTQVLGAGIVPNAPLPDGETEVRFQEREQIGLLVLFSTSF